MNEEEKIITVEHDDRRWWPMVVSVGASVLSAVLAAALCLTVTTNNRNRETEAREELQRQVCAIVVSLDDNYHEAPPATEAGGLNAASMNHLRLALGCEPPS